MVGRRSGKNERISMRTVLCRLLRSNRYHRLFKDAHKRRPLFPSFPSRLFFVRRFRVTRLARLDGFPHSSTWRLVSSRDAAVGREMQEVGRFSRVRALDRTGSIRILLRVYGFESGYRMGHQWMYTVRKISRLSSFFLSFLIHRCIRVVALE